MADVRKYAVTEVKIYFPDNDICCRLCPLLETYARKQCRRTGEYINEDKIQGIWCPLKILAIDEDEQF